MARSKEVARKSSGGKAHRKKLAKAARKSAKLGPNGGAKDQRPASKTQFNRNAVFQYAVDHSVRLTEIQKELIQVTKEKCERFMMLASTDTIHLLANLASAIKAKKTLDVGVFTGYSSLAIASVLPPGGKVVALDISEEYTNMAKVFWKKAGVEDKIDLRINPALDSLEKLVAAGEAGTYDFAFIDADKENYINYYELCLQLVRSGGIIAVDNVLWSGAVADETDQRESTKAIRAFNDKVRDDQRVSVSLLTAGDGVTLAFKK